MDPKIRGTLTLSNKSQTVRHRPNIDISTLLIFKDEIGQEFMYVLPLLEQSLLPVTEANLQEHLSFLKK